MESFLNQMREKFTVMEENKADHGGTTDQKIVPIQKTQSFKGKKKVQDWFPKLGRKMSQDYDSKEMEHAAAVAAATFAIDLQQELQTPEASLSKTKSKVDGTKSPISLLSSASKRFSGSFRSTDEQGNKLRTTISFRDEKKPEKAITPASSMKKSSTITDKKPEPPPLAMPIIRQDSSKPGPVRPPTPHPDTKKQALTVPGIGDTEADAWERNELEKIRQRYEKLKGTIDSWEKKKKIKAKRKLTMEEGELERRRMRSLDIFQNNMKYIDEVARGARSKAEETQRNEELKVKEKAMVIRKTGRLPGICSCF